MNQLVFYILHLYSKHTVSQSQGFNALYEYKLMERQFVFDKYFFSINYHFAVNIVMSHLTKVRSRIYH